MILDVLKNGKRYAALQEGFGKAMEFLSRPHLKEMPVGKYEIDGDRVYASISREPGRKKEDAPLETHEKYIDIQLVLDGFDDMGWKAKALCGNPTGAYDPAEDIQYFTDAPDTWLAVKPGTFAIFFPEDAHAPLVSAGEIHKVVVKVAVSPK